MRPKSLEARRKNSRIHHFENDIDNDWLISEIEEELLSDDSDTKASK